MEIGKDLQEKMDALGVKLEFDDGTNQYTASFGEFTEASMFLKRKKVEPGVHESPFYAVMLLAINAIEAFDYRRDPNLHVRLYLLYEAARAAKNAQGKESGER